MKIWRKKNIKVGRDCFRAKYKRGNSPYAGVGILGPSYLLLCPS